VAIEIHDHQCLMDPSQHHTTLTIDDHQEDDEWGISHSLCCFCLLPEKVGKFESLSNFLNWGYNWYKRVVLEMGNLFVSNANWNFSFWVDWCLGFDDLLLNFESGV
jgi:hypothetical protein